MEAKEAIRVRDAKRTKSGKATQKKTTGKQQSTVFDDVYRTMVQKMPELMIPLINEIFHTDYPEDIEKAQLRNEHLEIQRKLITDSILNISGKTYHIECQSTPDGQMALRMFEYGTAIALEEAQRQHPANIVPERIRFPFAAVLYLRSTTHTPDELTVIIELPGGREIPYRVPLIKVQAFSLDEIFQKRLFLFLPFYILRYEKDCAAIEQDSQRLGHLLDEYKHMSETLNEVLSAEDREARYGDLAKLIIRITDYILKNYRQAKKGVHAAMGGKVLELYSERLLRRGEAKGEAKATLSTLCSLVKKGFISVSVAAKELGVSEETFKKMAAML